MKKYKLITVLVTILLFTMCNEDLLDIPQQNVVSMDDYYANATDDQALSLIARVYTESYVVTNWSWIYLMNGLSDDSEATGGIYSNIDVNSQHHDGNTLFASFYRINYLCNLILEKLAGNSDVKEQVRGEAYFWRAWAYIHLIRLWGTPPLVDHVLTADELEPSNGTPAELWDYVTTSLEEAIDRLPEKSALGGQSTIGGRVTKHSAIALLGKAQVLSGDYASAVTTLGTVISSDKYELIADYTQLYHIDADFCDEYMWEWNMKDDATAVEYVYEGDFSTLKFAWNTDYVNTPGGIVKGVSGADVNKDLFDFFVDRGEKGKPRCYGTVWSYEDVLKRFYSLGIATDSTTDAISKFWVSASFPGCEGYFRSKMIPYESEIYPYWTTTYGGSTGGIRTMANRPGMRYAEVLLLQAEACVQSGLNSTDGLFALNLVRERAGLTPLGSYDLQDVKDEKRAELAYEGERYLDLIRWGNAETVLANRGTISYTFGGYKEGTVLPVPYDDGYSNYDVSSTTISGATGFTTNKNEFFPFPKSEMLVNPNLNQNPGWDY